jgi:hypothetical protein
VAWFYVDDGFSDSKPIMNLSTNPVRVPMRIAAAGAWVLGGSWSAKEELDGYIPHSKLKSLLIPRSVVAALCDPGPMDAALCCPKSDGISVRNWAKWQQTKAEIEARRKRDAEKKRNQRRRGRNYVTCIDGEMSPGDIVGDSPRDSENVSPGESPSPTPPHPLSNYSPTEEHSLNVGVERGLSDVITPSASRLVATVIPDQIPAAVRTALRIQASQLMNADGLDADTVAEALRRWLAKPGLGPALLPALAADVIRARATPTGKTHKLRSIATLAAAERAREQSALETETPKGIA